MKTSTLSLFDFFNQQFPKRRSEQMVRQCKKYHIVTVEQLMARINLVPPRFSSKDKKRRGIAQSYGKKRFKQQDIAQIIFSFKSQESVKFSALVATLPKRKYHYKLRKSELYLGAHFQKQRHTSTFWKHRSFNKTPQTYLLPHYNEHLQVFDQGQRGTCVANATAFAIDYVSKRKISRQFLYHQCKKSDGIPNESGTYVATSFDVLRNNNRKDRGVVEETVWPYVMKDTGSEAQGPAPEEAYHTRRIFSAQRVFTRYGSTVQDIKRLLVGSDGHSASPVVFGAYLFEGFSSVSTRETGWVTMPLPGEAATGGHAMVIVGYNDEDQVFIVRNSWGMGWAAQNKYGLKGHALIPYRYIEKYADEVGSILLTEEKQVDISPQYRLGGAHENEEEPKPWEDFKNNIFHVTMNITKIAAVLAIGFIGAPTIAPFVEPYMPVLKEVLLRIW